MNLPQARLTGFLGEGAVHRGELQFDGWARIDGHLIGVLRASELAEIGRSGVIEGEVLAPQVLVGGVVRGKIVASERCTLLETAVVSGELEAPWLDVRNGAQLEAKLTVRREST